MELPKLVIFDMDGLIFDSEETFFRQLKTVMDQYGYALTRENYIATTGFAWGDAERIMKGFYGEDYPFEEISLKTRSIVGEIAAKGELEVKPGIPRLLEFLKEKGIPCCVASSSPTSSVTAYLKAAGLDGYFCNMLGGESVAHTKPHPEIFLTACQSCGVHPEEALVLEDSAAGALAAINGSIPVIIIPDMKKPEREIAEKALLIAPDAYAVVDFLNLL